MSEIPEAYVYDADPHSPWPGQGLRLAARGQARLAGRRPDRRAPQPLPRAGHEHHRRRRARRRLADRRPGRRHRARPPPSRPGCPTRSAGVQLNRFCASGLEAVNTAAQKVRSGMEDLVLAGGVESMSRVPMGSDGGAWAMDPETTYQTGFVPAGHRRRPDRHPRGLLPRGRRHLRRRVAGPRGQGVGQRLLRQVRRARQGPQRADGAGPRRARPCGHHAGEPGRPAALVRDDRRRGRLRRRCAAALPLGREDRPRAPRRQLVGHRRRRRAHA